MKSAKLVLILAIGLFLTTKNSMAADSAASAECMATAQSFMAYLFNDKTDMGNDVAKQDKWLSKNLRNQVRKKKEMCDAAQKENPADKIEWPSNESFLRAWEVPAAYKILGSRRYGDVTIVDVELSWGKGKNYEGNKRIQSYIFVFEDKQWKLDDVYGLRENYAEPGNLDAELRAFP